MRLFVFVLVAGLVAAAASAGSGLQRHRDAVGDVKGGAGPDIAAVTVFEQAGLIRFRVEFAKAPPLALGRAFTDMLLIGISTTGKASPSRANAVLGVHAVDLAHVLFRRLPNGETVSSGRAVVSGKSVTLSLDPRRIGNPAAIRYSVAAGRELLEGEGGGGDQAPDAGTWRWVRSRG